MIYQGDVDGRSHEFGLEDAIPEFLNGTVEYDETTDQIVKSVYDRAERKNILKDFARKTDRFQDAIDKIEEEVGNALYILDNNNGEEYQHVLEAEKAYIDAVETYSEILDIEGADSPEIREKAAGYLAEVKEGIDSISDMADKPANSDLADVDEPTMP